MDRCINAVVGHPCPTTVTGLADVRGRAGRTVAVHGRDVRLPDGFTDLESPSDIVAAQKIVVVAHGLLRGLRQRQCWRDICTLLANREHARRFFPPLPKS